MTSTPWGMTLVFWPCLHQAIVLGQHDVWHNHWCPICDPGRRDPDCDVEYFDAH